MSIYMPYFYIIQDIRNGIYYAGSRWKQGCHPSELLREDGYPTSSETINNIIKQDGIDSFIIRKIKTFITPLEAYNYETKFLIKVDAANNPSFYNKHNNSRFAFGTVEFENLMLELLGSKNCSSLDWVKTKKKETYLRKYGVDNPLKNQEIKNKVLKTNNERYGGNSPFNSQNTIDIFARNNLEKYGYEWSMQRKEVKLKREETYLRKYGTNNPLKNPEIQEKSKNTIYKKYGVTHNSQIESTRESKKQKEQIKLNRSELDLLFAYSNIYNVKLGNGWRQRKDTWIYEKLDDLYKTYGELTFNQVKECCNTRITSQETQDQKATEAE